MNDILFRVNYLKYIFLDSYLPLKKYIEEDYRLMSSESVNSSTIINVVIIVIVFIVLLCTFPLKPSPKVQEFFMKLKMRLKSKIGSF